MISGLDTTDDWQKYSDSLAVLPIGAFEQHSAHLPLETDIRGAEYFAHVIAQDLNAALLPALPFGSSLEHAGFRGTVTLRPETLMHVLQDIARDVEAQAFRVLIVMNGHGGNFCLAPAVREWNRADRALKILLVHWWEFCEPALAHSDALEVHAGAFETSVMMAIAPDLVRGEQINSAHARQLRADGKIPLRQSDLNSFGVGHFSPNGAIGDATQASAEKGRAIVASVHENMLAFVRDRVERLRNAPRYAGRGGLAIRTLHESDLDAALRLKELVNWNQTPRDLQLFLQSGAQGNYAAVHNGRVIGTTATIRYENRIAWIGLVIVDPDFRGLGIGRSLLRGALEGLSDVPCVKLDATPDGKKLYDTLGFVDESTLQRWVCPAIRADAIGDRSTPSLRRATPDDLEAIAQLDAQTFGARRPALMQSLLEAAPCAWCLINENGEVTGFCLGREGTRYYQIGPLIAAHSDEARVLFDAVLRDLNGRPALIDVPDAQSEFAAHVQSSGFVSQRPLIRMRRGVESSDLQTQRLFAICGPEFG